MKYKYLLTMALLVFVSLPAVADADAKLSKQKGCASCHGGVRGVQVIEEMHAPPVREIAAKYRGNPNAENEMTRKMSDTAKHPEVRVSDAERQKLLHYFLTF